MQKSNGFSPLFYYFPLIYITKQYLVPKVLSTNKIWGYLFSPTVSFYKNAASHGFTKLSARTPKKVIAAKKITSLAFRGTPCPGSQIHKKYRTGTKKGIEEI